MNLATRLNLELHSYSRMEKVLDRMKQTLEWPEETSEYRDLLELLELKKQRIDSLKARLHIEHHT
jgi:hypothetical protein